MHWKNASAERKIKFLKCLSLFNVIDMTKTLLKLSSTPPYLIFRGWGDKAEPNPDLELNLTRILFLFPPSNHYAQIPIIVN